MRRIFRRSDSGSPRRSATGLLRRLPGGLLRRTSSGPKRLPWGGRAPAQPLAEQETQVAEAPAGGRTSFRDRGRLRRRLRFLRRARELAFRDIGGLIFDLRRFERQRPDLVEAKLDGLAAVDQELRALERILDDRRPLHELREPGISSCARCGALHSSEANFCPHCGLQFGGPRAMGEVGGAIAAPPQAPRAPAQPPPAAGAATAGGAPKPASSSKAPPAETMAPPRSPES